MERSDIGAVRSAKWFVVAVILLGVILRLVWIGDMEYKEDEQINVAFLARLGQSDFTPIAPVSQHAGIAHSSGFYYLVWFFMGGSKTPIAAGVAVAAINGVALGVALWIARHLRTARYALAMCATSVPLVVYSRKIWQPDLLVAWLCLGLGMLAAGLKLQSGPKRAVTLAASGLCFVLAVHMYLGAGVAAAVVGAYLFVWFLCTGRQADAIAWAAGSGLGWLSFIPWVLAILRRIPGSHGPTSMAKHWSSDPIPGLISSTLAVPAPVQFYETYLRPVEAVLQNSPWPYVFQTTRLLVGLAIILALTAFWLGLASVFAAWRKSFRDPVLVAALLAILLNGPALFAVRLGNHLHYWLAVVPLAFYVTAWSVTGAPHRHWATLQRMLAIGLCAVSTLASVAFLLLVNLNRGLPGEYGPAYGESNVAGAVNSGQ